jgi:two-component system, OmpR family, sensor histidine kinase VanS
VRLRTRIFLGMASLSIGAAALTWTLSFFLMEPYYLARKRAQLERIADEIGALPEGASSFQSELAAIERSTTVHVSVVGAGGKIEYDSSSPPGGGGARPEPFAPLRPDSPGPAPPRPADPPRFPLPGDADRTHPERDPRASSLEGGKLISSSAKWLVFERTDPRLGLRLLFLSKTLGSGSNLVLSFPISQATESARGALLFLTVSGAVAVLAGSILSYVLARSATKPFAQLMGMTASIASLDFSRRFSSRRDDEIAALGGTMNDLSASLRKALAELEEKNARLRADVERERAVEAMRKEFISSVSHELKTPIALIIGYAEGVMEGVAEGEEGKKAYLSVIVDEARKMDAQVRDLLELSQIDSGALPLRLEDFDMRRLVEEALASFSLALREKGIAPRVDLAEARVTGDREMLRRAVVNFASNAVSFIDERGTLEISLMKEDDRAVLRVFNSGPFVPAESLERVWDSYYKADASRKREFGGTGLGLAIVRGIVARHGGGCSVENVPPGPEEGDEAGSPAGVAFSFWIPESGPPPAP